MATRPAAPPVDVSTSSPDITTEPCSVELRKGDFARLKFRLVPGHRHDEQWQHRPVRAAPIMPAGQPAGPLAYYNNSKTASNSNVLQVILRDHGYSRVESFEEDWSIMWCAGQMDPKTLRLFMPHQRINKFPRATTLTLKSNLWMCVNHLRKAFGEEHFGFMPTTFCLPKEMAAFDAYMRSRLTAPGGEKDLWICKPTAAYCGRGIFLHRAGAYPKPMCVCRPARSPPQ